MDWNNLVPNCVNKQGIATLNCLPAVFKNIISAAFVFAGITALAFIIWSGLKYVISKGDPKKIEAARETLTYAIIGLVVILFSIFILNIISFATGVKCIKLFGFGNCQ